MMGLAQTVEKLKATWQQFYDRAIKPARCVFCEGEKLYWNGSRIRTASVQVEAEDHCEVVHLTDVACRRVKCAAPGCRKSWTLRPAGLFPRRHYQLCAVASATSRYLYEEKASEQSVADAFGCTRRTVGRWLTWISAIAEPGDLERHLLDASEVALIAKVPPVAGLSRKAAGWLRHKMLTRAARVLGSLEALGFALGYEPPGLRSVLAVVVNDRDRVSTLASPSIPEFARRRLVWPVAASAM